jgi:signal transduction histidine kinase
VRMRSLRRWPLTRKLTAIMVIASSAALLLTCAVLVAYDVVSFRRTLVLDLDTLSQVIGANSTAALVFRDVKAAEEVLSALAADEHLEEAVIFDPEGEPFARYVRDRGTPLRLGRAAPAGHRFDDRALTLHRPIVFEDERIGSVGLRSGLGALTGRMVGFGTIVLTALLVALGVAILLSTRLQRIISDPILDLVATTRRISERKDYSLRATAKSDDELGLLVGAFNEMLDQIDHRDRALSSSVERLEATRRSLVDRSHELERVNTELARSNRELEDFAFVASHDLQEPLRKIIAFGERLVTREGGALSEEGHDFVGRMRGAAARMQDLIDDLLAYSRVTTRARPFGPVPLDEVLEEVVTDLEMRIEGTGARVEVGPLPTIGADRVQMRQLFQNLLSNALKFHRPEVPPEIRVVGEVFDAEGNGTGRRCRIEIRDNGIGFDEKYLDRLFKPFHRLHGRGSYEGTGIGLAICKKIADRHGWTLTAESSPGAGATFIAVLPLEQGYRGPTS